MKGYVKKRGDRYYAVIYEGRDPVTGKERRSWHPGRHRPGRGRASRRQARRRRGGRVDAVRSLTFGAYLTSQWLPAKKLHLATSTYRGYERNVQRHILPALGRVGHPAAALPADRGALRRAPPPHRRARARTQDRVRDPPDHPGRARRRAAPRARHPQRRRRRPRTQAAVPPADRGRLADRGGAAPAHAHRRRPPAVPALWLTAMTGMRRNEVLGLKWPDIDFNKKRLHLNRGLVAVGYEVHQTRGKTKNARRSHRPRRHDPRRPRRLACLPGRRVRRRRHRQRRAVGVHRRRRRTRPSPRRLRGVPPDRAQRRRPDDPIPRSPPHPREPAHQGRRSRSRSSASGSGTPTSRSRCRPTSTSCPACRPTRPAPTERLAKPAPPASSDTGNVGGTRRRKTA